MSESEDKYVTIQDVADHYLVSISTIRAWMRTKMLPQEAYLRVGNTYRFKISVVDEHLRKANTVRFEKKMEEQKEMFNNPDQDL
jgi:DNA-binding transcriptional MerR regulator